MIPSDFSIEIADYERDLPHLRAVRDRVFVQEQQVPVAIELDALDPLCRHVVAKDLQGHPIGTGRLTPQRSIGRLAVLPDWRGRGVGEAMLQTLVDLARSLGYPQIELHSQKSAIGFYERYAFEAVGDEYLEAGIVHQTMRRSLDPFPEVERAPPAAAAEAREIMLESLPQTTQLALDIVSTARRNLWLYTRDLDKLLFGTSTMLDALKRFAIQSRGGELRILLQSPRAPLSEGHPLIPLAHRLSSCIRFRVPQEEQDLQYPAAFLLNDRAGYLLRPLGNRFEGNGNLHAPGRHRQLREYFEQVWERSLPDPELRPIHL